MKNKKYIKRIKRISLGQGWTAFDDGTMQYIENPDGEIVYIAREDVPFTKEVFRTIYNAFQCGVCQAVNIMVCLPNSYPNI